MRLPLKTRFEMALSVARARGEQATQTSFAEDVGIRPSTLHDILKGHTTSARVEQAAERFIARQFAEGGVRLASCAA